MNLLESISEEQKQKAFEKAREKYIFSEGRLVRVTEEYYRAALDFLRDVFLSAEPMYSVVDVRWSAELEQIWLNVLQCGFSLMLVDDETGETVAFRITGIHKKGGGHNLDDVPDLGTKLVWEYEEHCDKKAKLYERFGFDESLHLVALAVSPKYRQRGIAYKIMEAALYMYENLGVEPVLIKGEASSNYSKRVYAKSGFEELYALPYDEYILDGKQIFKNTGVHKSQASYGKVLNGQN